MENNHTNKAMYQTQVENIILNMKIIGNIQKQDKLSKNNDNVLEIENNDILQGIRRWYGGRNRTNTIQNLKKVINSCFDIIDVTLTNETSDHDDSKVKYFAEENSSLLQRFLVEMNSASKGLDNLKITYKEDITVVSEIECLKEQLDIRIKKINNLLKIDTSIVK